MGLMADSSIRRAGGQYKDDIYHKINPESTGALFEGNSLIALFFFFLQKIVIDLKYVGLLFFFNFFNALFFSACAQFGQLFVIYI